MENRGKSKSNGGFSIVEMVVAILLIAIIGATLISRFAEPSSFDAAIARDNAIAMALLAQQTALGRENVTFEIDPAGSDWEFAVAVSGTVIRSVVIPGNDLTLETGSVASGTCALGLDDNVSSNFMVTYDGNGFASGFSNSVSAPVPVSNGVRICVNDNVDFSACISPSGFAHQGDCDD